MTLSGLAEGERGIIYELEGGSARDRLMDLGFTPGAQVMCLFSAPSGEPRAYLIRGAVIALRRRDAGSIRLRRDGEDRVWA